MVSLQSKSQCTGPTVLTGELIDCPPRFMVLDLSACVFHREQIISAFVFSPPINVHDKMKRINKTKTDQMAHKADVAFVCVPAKK